MIISKKSSESRWGIPGAYAVQEEQINRLIGELLTIVDALGLRESQQKSAKDLVMQKVWSAFQSHDYVDGRVLVLYRDIQWQIRDEDNKRCFDQSKDNREKGLHDVPIEKEGEYELTFIKD